MILKHKKLKSSGFTAMEITMVATIIAIIALLILPLFRARTDEAKEVAARDEIDSIVKAEVLVNADTQNRHAECVIKRGVLGAAQCAAPGGTKTKAVNHLYSVIAIDIAGARLGVGGKRDCCQNSNKTNDFEQQFKPFHGSFHFRVSLFYLFNQAIYGKCVDSTPNMLVDVNYPV